MISILPPVPLPPDPEEEEERRRLGRHAPPPANPVRTKSYVIRRGDDARASGLIGDIALGLLMRPVARTVSLEVPGDAADADAEGGRTDQFVLVCKDTDYSGATGVLRMMRGAMAKFLGDFPGGMVSVHVGRRKGFLPSTSVIKVDQGALLGNEGTALAIDGADLPFGSVVRFSERVVVPGPQELSPNTSYLLGRRQGSSASEKVRFPENHYIILKEPGMEPRLPLRKSPSSLAMLEMERSLTSLSRSASAHEDLASAASGPSAPTGHAGSATAIPPKRAKPSKVVAFADTEGDEVAEEDSAPARVGLDVALGAGSTGAHHPAAGVADDDAGSRRLQQQPQAQPAKSNQSGGHAQLSTLIEGLLGAKKKTRFGGQRVTSGTLLRPGAGGGGGGGDDDEEGNKSDGEVDFLALFQEERRREREAEQYLRDLQVRQAQAAVVFQKFFRGHRVRRRLREARELANRRDRAATVIAALYKGFVVRKLSIQLAAELQRTQLRAIERHKRRQELLDSHRLIEDKRREDRQQRQMAKDAIRRNPAMLAEASAILQKELVMLLRGGPKLAEVAAFLEREAEGLRLKEQPLRNGWTPLHEAALLGQAEVISLLAERRYSTLVVDTQATADAAARARAEARARGPAVAALAPAAAPGKTLAGAGDVEDAEDDASVKPVMMTVVVPVPGYLSMWTPNIDAATTESGITPLLLACAALDLPCIRALLAAGASTTKADVHGVTPLILTSRAPGPEAAVLAAAAALFEDRWALDEGSGRLVRVTRLSVNSQDADGRSALHHACAKGRLQLARFLLANGADRNLLSNTRSTPAAKACEANEPACLSAALPRGAVLNTRNKDRRSMLHVCAERGFLACARVLLESPDIVVDSRDLEERTPLVLAVRARHVDLIEALLAHGADPNAEDARGYNVADHAAATEDETIFGPIAAAGGAITEGMLGVHPVLPKSMAAVSVSSPLKLRGARSGTPVAASSASAVPPRAKGNLAGQPLVPAAPPTPPAPRPVFVNLLPGQHRIQQPAASPLPSPRRPHSARPHPPRSAGATLSRVEEGMYAFGLASPKPRNDDPSARSSAGDAAAAAQAQAGGSTHSLRHPTLRPASAMSERTAASTASSAKPSPAISRESSRDFAKDEMLLRGGSRRAHASLGSPSPSASSPSSSSSFSTSDDDPGGRIKRTTVRAIARVAQWKNSGFGAPLGSRLSSAELVRNLPESSLPYLLRDAKEKRRGKKGKGKGKTSNSIKIKSPAPPQPHPPLEQYPSSHAAEAQPPCQCKPQRPPPCLKCLVKLVGQRGVVIEENDPPQALPSPARRMPDGKWAADSSIQTDPQRSVTPAIVTRPSPYRKVFLET